MLTSYQQRLSLLFQLRLPNEGGVVIAPVFSVNADSHWRFPLRTLADVLTKWTGSLTLVNVILQELPCVMTARNRYIHDLMQDCLEELKKPKKVSVCSQCGQSFEYNRLVHLFKFSVAQACRLDIYLAIQHKAKRFHYLNNYVPKISNRRPLFKLRQP